MKGYSKYFWFIHFIGDIFFINIAFIFMYLIKFESIEAHPIQGLFFFSSQEMERSI